jgi:hypothetical protein
MSEPLSLWNKTPTRQAILDFVAAIVTPSSPDFVPPAERIAVFDNDGTLWCEKPMYIQMDFILRQTVARYQRAGFTHTAALEGGLGAGLRLVWRGNCEPLPGG